MSNMASSLLRDLAAIRAQPAAPEIDHEYTHEVVCPYCGYENGDSGELGLYGTYNDGETTCGHCERDFAWERHIEVTYSTTKPAKEKVP